MVFQVAWLFIDRPERSAFTAYTIIRPWLRKWINSTAYPWGRHMFAIDWRCLHYNVCIRCRVWSSTCLFPQTRIHGLTVKIKYNSWQAFDCDRCVIFSRNYSLPCASHSGVAVGAGSTRSIVLVLELKLGCFWRCGRVLLGSCWVPLITLYHWWKWAKTWG